VKVEDIVTHVREYRGVTRKNAVSAITEALLSPPGGIVIATHGEDAAAVEYGGMVLLLATDGILEDLVDKDPYWAGYCSVLVNVNDIAAMGGMPLALVDVLSTSDDGKAALIVDGMRDAGEKFGVPIVGGHHHPDTDYTAVDVAILGETDREHLVLSSGARPGHEIIFAVDMEGRFTPGVPYSWDTTSLKDPEDVRRCIGSMHAVAPRLSAGKDVSNPGALGTLGMLLEASGAGATVDVEAIPRPDGIGLLQWISAYQGCGFVVTCEEASREHVVGEFSRRGLTAAVCGAVEEGSRLVIRYEDAEAELFDLSRDTLGCRVPQSL
jgi:putative methanogenesis marker protein 2